MEVKNAVPKIGDKGVCLCPYCGGKTKTRVVGNTVLKNFPLFCPHCKTTTQVNYP